MAVAWPQQAACLVKFSPSAPVCLSCFLQSTKCIHVQCLYQIILYLVASMRFGNSGQSGKVRNHPNARRMRAKTKLQLGLLWFRNQSKGAYRVRLQSACLKAEVSRDPGYVSSSRPFYSFQTLPRQKFMMGTFSNSHYFTHILSAIHQQLLVPLCQETIEANAMWLHHCKTLKRC